MRHVRRVFGLFGKGRRAHVSVGVFQLLRSKIQTDIKKAKKHKNAGIQNLHPVSELSKRRKVHPSLVPPA